jgi:hypothetical protein
MRHCADQFEDACNAFGRRLTDSKATDYRCEAKLQANPGGQLRRVRLGHLGLLFAVLVARLPQGREDAYAWHWHAAEQL